MAYNNLANDGSLQQFSELWESSRYSQRMAADPDNLGHMLEKTPEHQLPDLALCEMPPSRRRDMDDHRGIRRLDVEATDCIADDSTRNAAKSSKQLREDDEEKHDLLPKVGTPSWLSNALMRQQTQVSVSEGQKRVSGKWCSSCGVSGAHCMCRNMQTTSPSLSNHPYIDWLSAVPMGSTHPDDTSVEIPGSEHQRVILGLHMESGTGNEARSQNASNAGGEHPQERDESMSLPPVDRIKKWHEARLKAKLLTHPLFAQMVQAHVGCLKTATPVDQLPNIEEQLDQSQLVIDKYSVFVPEEGEDVDDKDELDDFMRNYATILLNMQEQLQNHVRVHATEAMVGCWELEQQFYTLTGVSPGSGNGATMSDDDDEQAAESDGKGYETGLDVIDSTGGFGPLVPTETERSLMERVRQDLKLELNEQGYREKIVDVRDEILRKRRAGKLPEGTTTVLKTWWNAHSKWPYPTLPFLTGKDVWKGMITDATGPDFCSQAPILSKEDEKERLIQETGLELKQVNNWFINQRKRNWHSNPLPSSNELKNKRKN